MMSINRSARACASRDARRCSRRCRQLWHRLRRRGGRQRGQYRGGSLRLWVVSLLHWRGGADPIVIIGRSRRRTRHYYDFVLDTSGSGTALVCYSKIMLPRNRSPYLRGCRVCCYLWYLRYILEHAIGSRRIDELFAEGLRLSRLRRCHG